MVSGPTFLAHDSFEVCSQDKRNELDKYPAFHCGVCMNAQPFHIQIIFQVVEILFYGILLPIRTECLAGILNVISNKDKSSDSVLFMISDCLLVVFDFTPPFRIGFDQKILTYELRILRPLTA